MMVLDGLHIWLTRSPMEEMNPTLLRFDLSYGELMLDDGRILHYALPMNNWSGVEEMTIEQLQQLRDCIADRRDEARIGGEVMSPLLFVVTLISLDGYIAERIAYESMQLVGVEYEMVPRQFRVTTTGREATEPSQRLIEDRRRSPSPERQGNTRGSARNALPPGSIPIGFTLDPSQAVAEDSSRAIMRESDDEDDDFKTSVAPKKDSRSRERSERTKPKYIQKSEKDIIRESESEDDNYKTSVAPKLRSKQKKKDSNKKVIEPKYGSSRAQSSSTTAKKYGTRVDPSASAWIDNPAGSGGASTASRYGASTTSTFTPRSSTTLVKDRMNKAKLSSSTHNPFASTTTTTLKPASSVSTSRSNRDVTSSSRSHTFGGATTSTSRAPASSSRPAQPSASRTSGSSVTRQVQSSSSQYVSSASRTTNPFATTSSRTSNATATATNRPRRHGQSPLAPVREEAEDMKSKKPYKPDMQYE